MKDELDFPSDSDESSSAYSPKRRFHSCGTSITSQLPSSSSSNSKDNGRARTRSSIDTSCSTPSSSSNCVSVPHSQDSSITTTTATSSSSMTKPRYSLSNTSVASSVTTICTAKSTSTTTPVSDRPPLRRTKAQRQQVRYQLAKVADREATTDPDCTTATSQERFVAQPLSSPSPSRRVRFTASTKRRESSPAQSLSQQSHSSSSTSSSAVPTLPNFRRKRSHDSRQGLWSDDATVDGRIPHKPPRPCGSLSTTRKVLRGAGMDVYAVQDSGTHQLLLDECLFACTSIREASSPRAAWEAAVPLAFTLVRKQSRRQLWQFSTSHESTAALSAILDLCGTVPTLHTRWNRKDPFVTAFRDVLGIVAHCLSLDCTLSPYASTKQASKFRYQILAHPDALQGLLSLVLADPITHRCRGAAGDEAANTDKGGTADAIASDRLPGDIGELVVSQSDTGHHNYLHDTPASQSSTGSLDPTTAGRRRRQRLRTQQAQPVGSPHRRLTTCPEEFTPPASTTDSAAPSELLSFASRSPGGDSVASNDSVLVQAQDQMDQATARVLDTLKDRDRQAEKHPHSYGNDVLSHPLQSVPLLAVQRIVTGKADDNSKSCMDDEGVTDQQETNWDPSQTKGSDRQPEDDDDDDNPLLRTNRLLGENGAIPMLAQAMAETLVAVTVLVRDPHACEGCLQYLHIRVATLASLVDGACLLNDRNRQAFCKEGFTTESGGCLVVCVLYVLESLLNANALWQAEGLCGEIGLECLRTLTSLTHENEVATRELAVDYRDLGWNKNTRGLDILARVLCSAVTTSGQPSGTEKLRYDAVIFCLNTLTNIVECGGNLSMMATLTFPVPVGDDSDHMFLSWLTTWLVGETGSFREAVVASTLGNAQSKHADRKLENEEDERLVTAGNGFVLLACLMLHKNGDTQGTTQVRAIRQMILSKLPGDNAGDKVTFVQNTLTAFCNFYHYSIGDLSVAVVAPVKKLIAELGVLSEDQSWSRNVDTPNW